MSVANFLVFAAAVVILRTIFHVQVQLGQALGFARPGWAWQQMVLLLSCPFGLLIHEFGHYLAGILLGQRCRRFVIGPIEFARGAGGWTVRVIPLRRAGLVDLVPSTMVRFRLQRAICAAGGPLASLLAGLLCLWASLHAHSATAFWIWNFSALWSLAGVSSLAPIRFGTARSDGYILLQAMRGGTAVDRMQRDLLTVASHATPLRIRDWPNDLVRRLADSPSEPQSQRFDCYLAYIHFLDRGEIQAAGQYLDRLMADWTTHDPPEYALEAAYFQAFHRNDLETAREWCELEAREAEPWVRLRTRAAIARSDGNPALARTLVVEALGLLQSAAGCGAYQYEIDRLRELLMQDGLAMAASHAG